jgi:hypothetical protein
MTNAKNASAVATLVALCLLACNEDKAKPEPPQAAPIASAAPSSGPVAQIPAAPSTAPVSGTVAETMDAGGYTYLRITTDQGEKWAAVPQAKLAVGDKVTILNSTVMKGFSSPTLKRTFDEILFGTLAGTPTPSIVSPNATASARASAAPASPSAPIAKAAGPNGHTIAEVFAGKTTMKDKPVVVRGRVTKYNAGILNRNWIHIVDGSGSKATGDNDLTVTTTQGEASVGDVIVVRGVLHLDKDFGGGYSYSVIVEDATLEK